MTTGIFAGLWDVLPCTNTSKYICKHLAEGASLTPAPQTVPPPQCADGWKRVASRNFCYKVRKKNEKLPSGAQTMSEPMKIESWIMELQYYSFFLNDSQSKRCYTTSSDGYHTTSSSTDLSCKSETAVEIQGLFLLLAILEMIGVIKATRTKQILSWCRNTSYKMKDTK